MSRTFLLTILSLLALLLTAAAIDPPTAIVRDNAGNIVTLPNMVGSTTYTGLSMPNPTVDVNPYTLTIDVGADCHVRLGHQLGSAVLVSASPAGVVLGGEYGVAGEYVLKFDIPSTGRLAMNLTYSAVKTEQEVMVDVSVANPHASA